jgi:hypothetical protein
VEAAYCAIIPQLFDHARAIWAILDVSLLNLTHRVLAHLRTD